MSAFRNSIQKGIGKSWTWPPAVCSVSDPLGLGVVEHFGAEITGEIGAGRLDRVRRADVGAWRHGQNVSGLGDEEAGGGGSGAARVNEGDHGHLGVQEARDDVV